MQTVQYPLRWWFIATVAASLLMAPLAPLVRSWPPEKFRLYCTFFLIEGIIGGLAAAFATWEWRQARRAAGAWLCRLTPPDRVALWVAFLATALGVGLFSFLDRFDAQLVGQSAGEPAAPITLGVFLVLGVLRAYMARLGDELRTEGVVLGANWHSWREVERFEWLPSDSLRQTLRFYVHGFSFESSVPSVDRAQIDALLTERWAAAHAGSEP